MKSSKKTNQVLKSCSSMVRGAGSPLVQMHEGSFLSLEEEVVKNCVVVLSEFSEKMELLGSTKYAGIKVFIGFLVKNPFYNLEYLELLLVASFWQSFSKYECPEKQEKYPLEMLIQWADLPYAQEEILTFEQENLTLLLNQLTETNPYILLQDLPSSFQIPPNLHVLITSFLDFSLTEIPFIFKGPRTFFFACFLASYQSIKAKPANLGDYCEEIKNLMPEAELLCHKILEKLHELTREEPHVVQTE